LGKVVPENAAQHRHTTDALKPGCNLRQSFTGPVFRPVDRWGHVGDRALCGLGVARAVKRALIALEVDIEDYSGHSS